MRVPRAELPNVAQISGWARENLPPHYRLLGVRCNYGTDFPQLLPDDWEITIEYVNTRGDSITCGLDDIKTHHTWADPLIAKIRAEWPASTVRIGIKERSPDNG